ncbi:MAG: phosphoribosylamine--glycine ligase [bacterium]|jgi:phosphoribosylamine--glycine ligase
MKYLVIGSGGREHALGWKLKQTEGSEVHFLPGNGGTLELGTNVEIQPADVAAVTGFARELEPDLVIVGPEDPLALGLVDALTDAGIQAFGPRAEGAQLESSKVFAKELMASSSIPTAQFKVFTSRERALEHVAKSKRPLVVKADGLAKGKGAIVTKNKREAAEAVERMMGERVFGDAGDTIIIEEKLRGEEASVIAVTDGEDYVLLPPSQDHKPAFDGDRGPNTGGMGAYCPAPVIDRQAMDRIEDVVFGRLLDGLKKKGISYRGVIYAGLILNKKGIFVIEFNARFGDPETQCMLPVIDIDLGNLLLDASRGSLGRTRKVRAENWAVSVVLASGGYPGSYRKDMVITGVERAASHDDVEVFHAGTRRAEDGSLRTSGGRVLAVTGMGDTLRAARRVAYNSVRLVRFEGAQNRRDIGVKGLARLEKLEVR